MSSCVVCGEYVPEGYGLVCALCKYRFDRREDLPDLENENRRLRMLLEMERRGHQKTKRALEKADHDRQRYAKRIRFLDERYRTLSKALGVALRQREAIGKEQSYVEA